MRYIDLDELHYGKDPRRAGTRWWQRAVACILLAGLMVSVGLVLAAYLRPTVHTNYPSSSYDLVESCPDYICQP